MKKNAISVLINGDMRFYYDLVDAMVVVEDAKDEDKEDPVVGGGHIIAKDCKEIDMVEDTYTTPIDMDRAIN